MSDSTVLEVRALTKRFGGVTALSSVSLQIRTGELVGLVGPNGSGKTTLFDCITGFVPPDNGLVFFLGQDVTGLPPHTLSLKGMIRTFQSARLFARLPLVTNMLLALQQHQRLPGALSILCTSRSRELERQARERAMMLLELVGLEAFADTAARNLSHGQRKLLNVAMALMPEPRIMLLDEPSAAVNPVMIERIKEVLRELNQQGQTLFVIEHNMRLVSDLCQRVIVLDQGEKIAEGTPEAVQRDERVIQAYFGREHG